MKLYYPYEKPMFVTQGFSQNKNTYYAEDRLAGHTGVDMIKQYGATIYSACEGTVFAIRNQNNPDLMKYRAVYVLYEDTDGLCYEVSYGHLQDIFVTVGQKVKVGTPIGTEGNTGDVATQGKKVTLAMKQKTPGIGSHLHFQVRLIQLVTKVEDGQHYLTNDGGLYKKGIYYCLIPYYKNGFNGCIDPAPFWISRYAKDNTAAPLITTTLRYGSRGEQVKLLQKKLKIPQDGVFGYQTDKYVRAYQKKKKLTVDGIVGQKTRELLNQQ